MNKINKLDIKVKKKYKATIKFDSSIFVQVNTIEKLADLRVAQVQI
jgi:hypothetical protein